MVVENPPTIDAGLSADFLHEVSDIGRLRVGWSHTRAARGAPGVDRVTVARIIPQAEQVLASLQRQVRSGRYRPPPLRRTFMPKADGTFRVVGIPTVSDRIVQGAATLALHDRIGPQFSDASFAYRPLLGPKRAAEQLATLLRPGSWAVIADVERFFDTVDHGCLLRLVSEAGVDAAGVKLIEAWLRAPVEDGQFRLQPVKGLPQGGPISPILANLYLTGFDRALEQRGDPHVRFADDFVIVARAEEHAREILAFLTDWLRRERMLAIKAAKTLFTPVEQGFVFVGLLFTATTRTLPAEKAEGFKTRIATLLADPPTLEVAEVVRRHNDLVRGWRNYYGAVTPELDAQLHALERWRHASATAFWKARNVDDRLGRAALESLRVDPERTAEPMVEYARWPEAPDPPHAIPGDDPDPWQLVHWPRGARPARVFSTRSALRNHAIGERQRPLLTADRVLHVPTHGSYLTRRKGLLVVRRKKQPVFECARREVGLVTVSGQGVALSSTALLELAQRRVSVILTSAGGAPVARVVPVRSERRVRLLEVQLLARSGVRGATLAREIVVAKIRNQRALLRYHAKYRRRPAAVIRELARAAAAIGECVVAAQGLLGTTLADTRRPLFLLEARAARHYWCAIGRLVPTDWEFPGRRGRGARDPMNALLNYGYALLANRVWWAIERQGLHPYLGFLHTSRRERPGLVFDLMEEFRQPLVDRAILGLIGRGSRVVMRQEGRLAMRTLRRVERAIERGLERRLRRRSGNTLAGEIVGSARAIRRALMEGGPYRGHRMAW